MIRIVVLNGPNLHRLGRREPQWYGASTLADITGQLDDWADGNGVALSHFQSNAEADLIDRIYQEADAGTQMAIFNPGAFTHTSIALRDALLASEMPFIEVHLSNVAGRDAFRQTNFFADIARGSITGLGAQGYGLALQAALALINQEKT